MEKIKILSQNSDISDKFPFLVETIIKEINPDKVILFGSYAKGNETKNSDIDLLIIENETFNIQKSRWKEITKIRNILSQFKIPKDILLFSVDEIEKWKDSKNHIIYSILKEGTVLYER